MATAATAAATRVRHDLVMLRWWLCHWKLDSKMGLASTEFSLDEAMKIADRAIEELKEMERS